MAICVYCKGEHPDDALVCMHCGQGTPVGKETRAGDRSRIGMWVIVGLGAAFLLLVFMISQQKPQTYQDEANHQTDRCVEANGYGEWRGSSGLTLHDYCQGISSAKTIVQMEKEHPERF